jgi:hypothetical protein
MTQVSLCRGGPARHPLVSQKAKAAERWDESATEFGMTGQKDGTQVGWSSEVLLTGPQMATIKK